ncbi:MAG: hypothetical protein ABSF88_11470 [Candidatus Aminicenantales bacterium]
MRKKNESNTMKIVLGVILALALSPLIMRAQVGIVNGLTQEKICKPGEMFESFITLKNNGPKEETVKIYQTDYSFTADGKTYYDAPGKIGRSNAAWITVGPKQVTIPGQATMDVRYSCKVPAGTSLVGTYWSIIMFEVIPPAQRVKRDADKKEINFGVSQVMRYGVQIVTHFGETGARSLKFLKTELLQDKKQKTLQVDIENNGERWLRPFSYVELYNEKGEPAGKIEGERWRIFPGTSVRYRFDASSLKKGVYNALIVFDNKDASVFGAQYKLNVTQSAPPAAAPAKVKKSPETAAVAAANIASAGQTVKK